MIIKIIKTVIWIFLIIVLISVSLQLLEKILFKIYSIDAEEMACLETGCCHEGYRFKYCGWQEGCVVSEYTCKGRGQWDAKKHICCFNE